MFTLKLSKSFFHFLGICGLVFAILTGCNGGDLDGTSGNQGGQSGDGDNQADIALVAEEAPLLVFVAPGEFKMGSTEEDLVAGDDEFPLHTVQLPGFLIHGHEVTNEMYQICVEEGECSPPTISEDGPSKFYSDPNYGDNPVVGVDWFQAKAYCEFAEMRLPTEAEWEYTARATTSFLYPWGDTQPDELLANTSGINNERFPEEPQTDDVDLRPEGESEWEARDLAGNVMEWVWDWYDPDYYAVSPAFNPQGPPDDEGRTEKVVRGGGWDSTPEDARSTARFALDPLTTREDLGFRCIPLGQNRARAPFCVETGTPFCVPREGGDTPGEECDLVPPPNINRIGVGCPNDDGTITVIVSTDASPDEISTSFGGNDFNCVEENGVLICTGPRPPTNANINFTMCAGPNGQTGNYDTNALVAFNAAPSRTNEGASPLVTYPAGPSAPGAARLVTYDQFQAQTNPDDLDQFCGQYETFVNGRCERIEDGCPRGTTWTEFGCMPDNGGDDCGDWDYNLESGYCEPPGGGEEGLCSEGYVFDPSSNCCTYIPGDNFGCEEGFFYNYEYDRCWPTTEDGCEPGYVFDRQEGCVPGEDRPDGETMIPTTEEDCPPFTALTNIAGRDHCQPTGEDGGGNNEQSTNNGYDYAVGQTGPPCSEGQVRNANGACESPDDGTDQYDRCKELGGVYVDGQCYTGDDGCGPGYFRNLQTEECIPTGGQCDPGSAYNSEYDCCTPDNYCPGGEDDFQTRTPLTLDVYSPNYPAGYNPDSGYCDPGDDDGCLPGYVRNDQEVCVPGRDDECGPNGYMSQSGVCQPYDEFGCELGEYWNGQACEPYSDNGTSNLGCPLGYIFNGETCTPMQTSFPGLPGQITTSSCEEGCITLNVYVDACDDPGRNDPCANIPGTRYDDVTESCIPTRDIVCEVVCTGSAYDCQMGFGPYQTVCEER